MVRNPQQREPEPCHRVGVGYSRGSMVRVLAVEDRDVRGRRWARYGRVTAV